MGIAAVIFSVAFLILYSTTIIFSLIKSQGVYDDWIEPLDEKEYKIKKFLPIGLFLNDTIRITKYLPNKAADLLKRYDGIVSGQIVELNGFQQREYYYALHCAERWILSLIIGEFIALFSLIMYSRGEETIAFVLSLLIPIATAAAPFINDSGLKSKIEERRESIQMEFPEFVNKLILLVNAGSTIPKAWDKIVKDSDKNTPLFIELRVCSMDIQAGKSEAVAYEEFGRRCKVKEVIKMVSIIVLNIRKGGSEVVPALRAQADECWEARKATARRLGEKASSKLMLPMAIMLVGIIIIVALPAILSLAGM